MTIEEAIAVCLESSLFDRDKNDYNFKRLAEALRTLNCNSDHVVSYVLQHLNDSTNVKTAHSLVNLLFHLSPKFLEKSNDVGARFVKIGSVSLSTREKLELCLKALDCCYTAVEMSVPLHIENLPPTAKTEANLEHVSLRIQARAIVASFFILRTKQPVRDRLVSCVPVLYELAKMLKSIPYSLINIDKANGEELSLIKNNSGYFNSVLEKINLGLAELIMQIVNGQPKNDETVVSSEMYGTEMFVIARALDETEVKKAALAWCSFLNVLDSRSIEASELKILIESMN